VGWEVEYTDAFEQWWDGLTTEEQVSVAAYVELLEHRGPNPRWYRTQVTIADRLYDAHLDSLRREGLINGEEVP
jgi:hypothetical protein